MMQVGVHAHAPLTELVQGPGLDQLRRLYLWHPTTDAQSSVHIPFVQLKDRSDEAAIDCARLK